jgi:hypothetical protein
MSKAKVLTPKRNSGEKKSARNVSTGNTSSAQLFATKESKKCEKGKSVVWQKVVHAGSPGMIVEEAAEIEAAAGIAAAALPARLRHSPRGSGSGRSGCGWWCAHGRCRA